MEGGSDDLELGDVVIKTEPNPDENDECEDIEDVEPPEISSQQRQAMAKYSEQINQDMKTKVKKLKDNLFQCKICKITRATLQSFRAHLSSHREGNPFICPYPMCRKESPCEHNLNIHIKSHLPPEGTYKCRVKGCGAKFPTKTQLNAHSFCHTERRPWKCPNKGCKKAFKSKSGLNAHVKIHKEGRPEFVCQEENCGLRFKSKIGFIQHSDRHKGIYKSGRFSCYFCDRLFLTPIALEFHIGGRHLLERPYKCKICKMWTSTPSSLRNHMLIHKKTEPFPCPHCSQLLKRKHDLAKHIKIKHTEGETYKCIHCDYETRSMKDLVTHGRRKHEEYKFQCSKCSKSYPEKHFLDLHVKSYHTEERDFKCHICKRGFVTSLGLKGHMTVHSDDRPFGCHLCEATYKSRNARAKHLKRVHNLGTAKTEFKCYFCAKVYNAYSGYDKHIRTHTMERPFLCPQPGCKKKWLTTADTLKYHLGSVHGIGKFVYKRSNNAERFKCGRCKKNYKYKQELRKHERIVHDKTATVHKCQEAGCDYSCYSKTLLQSHINYIHLNIHYTCKSCGQSWKKKSNLAKHIKKGDCC